MAYAIIEIGGKQIWVEKNKFYNISKVKANLGSKIRFNRILLTHNDKNILIGLPYIKDSYVDAVLLQCIKGSKISIFKMKPKKKMQRKIGFREDFVKIFITNIN